MNAEPVILDVAALSELLDGLRLAGYRIVAPVVRDGAAVLAEISTIDELPAGWVDEQEPGGHRLQHTSSPALFSMSHGPQSPKGHLLPQRTALVVETRGEGGWTFTAGEPRPQPVAFLGVHPCDVASIRILDRVLLEGGHPDAVYGARRHDTFVVAVTCGRAGATCFCTSMGTGPRATEGHDIALTELVDAAGHRFLAQAGSAGGAAMLDALPFRAATDADVRAADDVAAAAEAGMTRSLDTDGLRELLQASWDHPRWAEVARRCLSCGNCTLVCPTCFCTTVEEAVDLSGDAARRERRWDTCFSLGHSYIHGGSVRASTRSRYRQWMTHKLSTWIDQFGTSGCVGCGRCITWCPVGIDITEEAAAIRAVPPQARGLT